MSKLQEIKDQVARDLGWKNWSEMKANITSDYIDGIYDSKVVPLFARAVAEDAVKRAAETAKDRTPLGFNQEGMYDSILSTEINLDLAIEKGAEG